MHRPLMNARRFRFRLPLALVCAAVVAGPPAASRAETGGATSFVVPVRSAVVHFGELARQEALGLGPQLPPRPLIRRDRINEMDEEPGADEKGRPSPEAFVTPPLGPHLVSPPPSSSFMGLGDIAMVDLGYIIIPPDVGGAVGLTRTLSGHNNNYRVLNKSNGAVISTVGTATFWDPVIEDNSLLNQLTDPRTTYDPIEDRWISCMQTVNTSGMMMIAVSATGDPAGVWYEYAFDSLGGGNYQIDFPNLGFNKNWIAATINRYNTNGAFERGITVIASYPEARTGTLTTATVVSQGVGTRFTSSPAVTYSATQETLFVVTHLSSNNASYVVDVITGTETPTYTHGLTQIRPGGNWSQPTGQVLPQSPPNAGASVCSPPCPLECQDGQIRSAPIYRNGALYYVQTIGLPASGFTHSAVQWTKLTVSFGYATFQEGGRINDPTATSNNGGKWYVYPAIAVNDANDFLIGFSQFSSAQHPSAGYAFHHHTDAAGTVRDPLIYKAGEDYYHKDFGSGRNRWGDFSSAAVDPSDDRSLWVLQEYAGARLGTDDGPGGNSSRWSTWWAKVTPDDPPIAHVLSPDGNENFTVGSVHELTWEATDDNAVTSVTLSLSRDNGTSYETLAGAIPNSGSYEWTVTPPGTNVDATPVYSALFQVKALDGAGQEGADLSDAPFSIFDPGVVSGVTLLDPDHPKEFALGRTWPNPARGPLRTEFSVAQPAEVRLSMVDVTGREVVVLAKGRYAPGRYRASWDGRTEHGPLPAGVYFVRFRAPGLAFVNRIAIAR